MYSMTGFGRGQHEVAQGRVEVELRSVNHRGLDVRVQLPAALASCEGAVKRWCRERIGRGRVQVRVAWVGEGEEGGLKREVVVRCHAALEEMREMLGLVEPVGLSHVLSMMRGVDVSDEHVVLASPWEVLEAALEAARVRFEASRRREGAALREVLEAALARVVVALEEATARAPQRVDAYRARLEARVQALLEDGQVAGVGVDPQRLAMEVALFADRVDVREELDRASAHVEALREVLEGEGGASTRVGKRLDFLLQELNREANTLASKARDVDLTQRAIEMKTQIESMREQVANIQ